MCSTDYIEPSLAPSKVIGIYSCAVQRSSPANSKVYSKNHSGGEAETQSRVKGAMAPPSTVPPPRIPRVEMLQAKLKVKKPVDLVCGNKQASEPIAAELATIVASISTSLEKSMGSRGKQQAASTVTSSFTYPGEEASSPRVQERGSSRPKTPAKEESQIAGARRDQVCTKRLDESSDTPEVAENRGQARC